MKRTIKFSKTNQIKEAYEKTDIPNIYYLKLKSPLTIQIELTRGCTQKCIFCYNVWKEGNSKKLFKKDLSKEDHLKIIEEIIKNEIFDVIFSGGEPLLIKWLEELIQKLSKKNINVRIITNGTLLDKARVNSLKKAGLNHLQISLHHFSEERNNKLVGNKNAFKKTIIGIRNALEVFGEDNVNVNMVALPETYKDVYQMALFLNSIGVKNFSIGCPSATGKMSKDKTMVINKKKFLKVYKQLKNAEKDFTMQVSFTGGFPLCILPNMESNIKMVSNYCDAGLNQLVISPEGNIRPCVCLNENLGNILKDNLKEIWEKNNFLLNLRKLKYIPEKCKKCAYLSLCRGGCRASAKGYYGKINSLDPLIE